MITRFWDSLIEYVALPALMFWLSVHAALWNEGIFTKDQSRGLLSGVFFMLLLGAFAYERGYKRYYRIGRKQYFYVVYVSSLGLAIVGFLYGLWGAYVYAR